MFTPLELFIGQRYTHSQRRNRFISFISFASMLGILLGVMVLITVLSIMNGFEKELRDKILGVVSHVTVSGTNGQLADWTAKIDGLKAQQHVIGAAPYVQKQVMLTNGNLMRGIVLQGIDPKLQNQVSDVNFKMLEGSFNSLAPRDYGIVLGVEVATALGVMPGDKVTVIVPQVQVTPAGILPRLKRFTVTGIYQIGHPEYDGMTGFIELSDASRLFRLGDNIGGIRLKLDDLFAAPAIGHELQTQLGKEFEVVDWSEEHGSFFRAVKTERIAMTLILFLVVCVALFNLVASLMMAVNDKESDIAILRTFGMSGQRIMRIFMIQGSIIGIFGTLVGVGLGVWLSLNIDTVIPFLENTFGFKIFSSDVFYISEIPSDMRWENVIWIGVASLIASVLATIYPAWRASQIQPAESLRYE
ncbi:lipoprotein-releasing ABC transporter permease subunit [Thiothrix subterranea]|uniref:Lipoprotein-releasing ABC transporter permease subunit n=1 Tax=Thiothrix subterranea TaxID=2735563 RepID=A0AA51MK98_9GAMM|nr:lipoprotein-releasing ABC transporter permease subunit [Thiothrix subterranea]MDQ5769915.1 lipoprotein-releasing ABC transporter permease subunit [Thiothrix subterranea]WML86059.1 lipoprotein-releasing ABC transporter permease subunit [Thiothrix subterranea]